MRASYGVSSFIDPFFSGCWRRLIEGRHLCHGDLMLAQDLTHNIEQHTFN